MPAKVKLKSAKPRKQEFTFPLGRENFIIIGIGILTLVIGYILMAENSVDGFLPTVVAPILLVLGYCVIIPYGILKRAGNTVSDSVEINTGSGEKPENSLGGQSSNIRTASS